MIKAVTFDFWWTLYQMPPEAHAQRRVDELHRILAAAGHSVNPETLAGAVRSVRHENQRMQEEEGLDWSAEEQVAQLLRQLQLPANLVSALVDPWTTTLLDHKPAPMPGAQEVVADLARRYRLAVICNTGATPGWVLRRFLAADGLADHFQVLTFSNEHGVAKPNPTIFRRTLAGLGVPPETAVHVGDTPHTDVTGAHRVGMRAIWLNSRNLAPSPAAQEADETATTLVEVVDRIAALAAS